MAESSFPAFRPIPRLHREITITEKIDGTNGLISIERRSFGSAAGGVPQHVLWVILDTTDLDKDQYPMWEFWVSAGSHKRWLTPTDDNYGFAAWVIVNVHTLVHDLGEGNHYGEWWGHGIQRGYGLPKGDRRFSLFNVSRWTTDDGPIKFATPGLDVVPVIYSRAPGEFLSTYVCDALESLRWRGSDAVEGYGKPEGIVIYHHASNSLFKVTLENDEVPKSLVGSDIKAAA